MKRKYYLRGLGIGILVTALVFIIAGPSKMSDEEVIKRAKELGYTKAEEDSGSLGIKDLLETGTPAPSQTPVAEQSLTPVPTPTKEPTETPEPTEKPEATPTDMAKTPTPTLTPTPVPTETPTPTPAPTETPTPTPVPPQDEVVEVTIVIERGNTATTVCNKIAEAGVIKDSKELRNYLVNNNLTDYINVGTYTLSSDMSLEEIAKIITGR